MERLDGLFEIDGREEDGSEGLVGGEGGGIEGGGGEHCFAGGGGVGGIEGGGTGSPSGGTGGVQTRLLHQSDFDDGVSGVAELVRDRLGQGFERHRCGGEGKCVLSGGIGLVIADGENVSGGGEGGRGRVGCEWV